MLTTPQPICYGPWRTNMTPVERYAFSIGVFLRSPRLQHLTDLRKQSLRFFSMSWPRLLPRTPSSRFTSSVQSHPWNIPCIRPIIGDAQLNHAALASFCNTVLLSMLFYLRGIAEEMLFLLFQFPPISVSKVPNFSPLVW